jgi:hypothetical protein
MNSSSGWLVRKPAGIVFNEYTDEDGATVFRHFLLQPARVRGFGPKIQGR